MNKLVLGILFLAFPPAIAPNSEVRPFRELTFEAGDTILIPSWTHKLNIYSPPFHSFFAISKSEILHSKVNGPFDTDVLFKITRPDKFVPHWRRVVSKTIKPDIICRETIIDKGVILAARMNLMLLPYRFFRCNCRHYTDYLTYGETFGKWYMPWYLPAGASCPVHLKITSNTDVTVENFSLRDKDGTPYPLRNVWMDPETREEVRATAQEDLLETKGQ